MNVLISRPDKIGDVLLAMHGAKQLKKLLPEAKVFVHAQKYTADVVNNLKFVDGCLLFEDEYDAPQFDVVVDLMAKARTARRYLAPRINVRIGNAARWFRFYYNRTRILRRSRALLNEAEYNWQLISLVDHRLQHTRLTESLGPEDFKELPTSTDITNYTVLMPGAAVSAIGWPFENWVELAKIEADKDDGSVIIALGPAEASSFDQFAEQLGDHPNIQIRLFDNIVTLSGFIYGAKRYVGLSTGITHIAGALKIPGVALYPERQSMHPNRWMPFDSKLQVASLSTEPTAQEVSALLAGTPVTRILPRGRVPVSAFVICLNEEKNIRRCLESIKWCDEIVIVDNGSTDRTLEICREYTDKIFYREWTGHSDQKQFALDRCSHDWVLNIDSDEEVSAELKAEINRVLSLPDKQRNRIHGYQLSRLVRFLDRWWDKGGWFPEYRMRFFQKAYTRWGGLDPHEKALVDGRIRKLPGHIYHYTYRSISHQIDCLNKHSALAAERLYRSGTRCSLVNLVCNPAVRFVKFYLFKTGFREGRPGFNVAIVESFYTYMKYLKLWELQRNEQKADVVPLHSPSRSHKKAHNS